MTITFQFLAFGPLRRGSSLPVRRFAHLWERLLENGEWLVG